MNDTEFVIELGPADRIREYHVRSRGRIISFMVQYETFCKNRWLPVARYDSAHGFAHRDLYDAKGTTTKTPLFMRDYNQRERFVKGVGE